MMRMRMAREQLVWTAMAAAEAAHGGPRTLTVNDVQKHMAPERAAPTVRRALRTLADMGIVRHVGHVGNGLHGWQLEPPGRAKYRLPNEHRGREVA